MEARDVSYLFSQLQREFGARRVVCDPASRMAYGRDASPLAVKTVPLGAATWQPDIIVWPETAVEVARVTEIARQANVPLVPYGAGSGVVGGALALNGGIVIDLKKMNQILNVDPTSMTVTTQAGVLGQQLEEVLNASQYTTGHYPQSIHSSTVGGWIAHRGIGTFSTKYGKVDDLLVALEVVLPSGKILRTRKVPQSAAGPDLNRLFLGSEGVFGTITEATLKIFPLPEARSLLSFTFDGFGAGLECMRRAIQGGLSLAAVRIYDPLDAATSFPEVPLGEHDALGLVIIEGNPEQVDLTERQFTALASELHTRSAGCEVPAIWLTRRFNTAGLCRVFASSNGIADTLEVANSWDRLNHTYGAMRANMMSVVGDKGAVYGHASHIYHSGANIYMVFHTLAREGASVEETYYEVLDAAFSACLATGGTITHHHGVGLTKGHWMSGELGEPGMEVLEIIKSGLDPTGIMNPGKLGLSAPGKW